MPSGLVAALAPPVAKVTKVPLPYVTLYQSPLEGSVLAVAEKPPLSLFCHWYESVPLGSTTAVVENVALPPLAVLFVGGDVIVIEAENPLLPKKNPPSSASFAPIPPLLVEAIVSVEPLGVIVMLLPAASVSEPVRLLSEVT
jgi:hypothetical protein